ncbi:MAG: sugar phosphate isomerase/epimerase [Clostridiales bacterium]|nr:sugar phosphate isomerase/epimerase [Clostridiales bacterium]
MSLGIRVHDIAPGTLGERAAIAKQQGFGCVHLALSKTISPDYMTPTYATPGLASFVHSELDGLDIAVLGCYLNPAHPDEQEYQAILQKYFAHLRLCKWMGADLVGTETGNPNAGYRYDPQQSHTDESLELFIQRVTPIVQAAEKLGVTFAIEPVYTHIVSDAKRARRVLDHFSSPCFQIILDPVNLLHADNIDRRDAVIEEAIELLGDDTAVIHIKDYQFIDGKVISVAAGTGEMDYTSILKFATASKPHIHMTFEDTKPENAEAARKHIQQLLDMAK